MKNKLNFDPINGILSDVRGQFLKRIHCPMLKVWQDLSQDIEGNIGNRFCDSCANVVLDTAYMTSKEIVDVVKNDHQVCLRIGLDQENIIIKVPYY